jgi:hypothetical protein
VAASHRPALNGDLPNNGWRVHVDNASGIVAEVSVWAVCTTADSLRWG